jgi:excisionase family DNA binding protein
MAITDQPPTGTLENLLAEQIASQVRVLLADHLATPQQPVQQLFTVKQAAIYLGRTTKALQHMIADGKLPVPLVRIDRKIYLHRTDLDRWIEDNKY